jgi:hypothetical protein
MRPRYCFLAPVVASLVIPLGLAGAQTASAKTPPKPAPKTRLLPANLSCAGLLTGPDWGAHIETVYNLSDPCTFGIPDKEQDSLNKDGLDQTAHVTGGALTCQAVIPYKGANLLPKFIKTGDGKVGPDYTPRHLGMDAEIFFGDSMDDAQSVPPSASAVGYLQVRNATCFFQVESTTNVNPPNANTGAPPPSWGYNPGPVLHATIGLVRIVNSELGG